MARSHRSHRSASGIAFSKSYVNATWFIETSANQMELITDDRVDHLRSLLDETLVSTYFRLGQYPPYGQLYIGRLGSGLTYTSSNSYRKVEYQGLKFRCEATRVGSLKDKNNVDFDGTSESRVQNWIIWIWNHRSRQACGCDCDCDLKQRKTKESLTLSSGQRLNLSCAASCPLAGVCTLRWRWHPMTTSREKTIEFTTTTTMNTTTNTTTNMTTIPSNRTTIDLDNHTTTWKHCAGSICEISFNLSILWNQSMDGTFLCQFRDFSDR